MQLRNGKKTDVDNAILNKFKSIYGDIVHVYVWRNGYETVMLPRIRNDFQYINDHFDEICENRHFYRVVGNDCEHVVAKLYKRSVQLTAEIIDMTYYIDPTDEEKSLIIQTLATLRRTTTIMGWLLYHIVREDKNRRTLDKIRFDSQGNCSSDLMLMFYRCLLHMYDPDVGDAEISYGIEEYRNCDYTDVELYDWYINYDSDGPGDDPYINTYEKCFSGKINYVNKLYWWT